MVVPAMTDHTVFVIGAGASTEVNLPTGEGLKKDLTHRLNIGFDSHRQESGDLIIGNALRILFEQSGYEQDEITSYLNAIWQIRDALPKAISIDDLINAHGSDDKVVTCGKLAIVRSILAAEQESLLCFKKERLDSTIDLSRLEKTWYFAFFKLLTEGCSKADLDERLERLTLIVFNYDRCIEHFLFHAFKNYYGLSALEARGRLDIIKILHPYGDVGRLSWRAESGAPVEFGQEPAPRHLLESAQRIKTFTEGTDPGSTEILAVRKQLGMANRVVFLGFGFHGLNMQLISPKEADVMITPNGRCFATTLGFSDSDKDVIESRIRSALPGKFSSDQSIKMLNAGCNELFQHFRMSLSF